MAELDTIELENSSDAELLRMRDNYNIVVGAHNKLLNQINGILYKRSRKILLWVIIEEAIIHKAFEESEHNEAIDKLVRMIENSYVDEEVRFTLRLREYPESKVQELLDL